MKRVQVSRRTEKEMGKQKQQEKRQKKGQNENAK